MLGLKRKVSTILNAKKPLTTAKQNETDKPMDLANNDSLIKRQSMRGLNVQKINDKIGSIS